MFILFLNKFHTAKHTRQTVMLLFVSRIRIVICVHFSFNRQKKNSEKILHVLSEHREEEEKRQSVEFFPAVFLARFWRYEMNSTYVYKFNMLTHRLIFLDNWPYLWNLYNIRVNVSLLNERNEQKS